MRVVFTYQTLMVSLIGKVSWHSPRPYSSVLTYFIIFLSAEKKKINVIRSDGWGSQTSGPWMANACTHSARVETLVDLKKLHVIYPLIYV